VECFSVFEAAAPGASIGPAAGEECHETFPANDRLVESVIPVGCVMLSFNLGDPFTLERDALEATLREPSHVVGPDTGRARMGLGRRVEFLGVMFRPGRAAPFLGVPAHEVAGRFQPLDDLWGRDGRRLDEEILDLPTTPMRIARIERELLRRLRQHGAPDPRFASLADLIGRHGGAVRVEALSDASGLTRQHLARKFRELVGVAPKQFCRLARFDLLFKAAYQKPRVDWAAVALGCGYYDQAHLIAEFKDFTGMTPTAFFLPAPASVAD
jgi:AraC-like DNA-binding protein